ncbi:membrane protein [Gordonia phage Nodigi]|nr:membrane protein [Gordonia phage Nodigi]
MIAAVAIAFIVFLNATAGLAYWSVWYPQGRIARIVSWLEGH